MHLFFLSLQGYMLSWDVFWDLSSNLIISGCDSTLTVLGMSAVISSVAHYLGLSILAFIGMDYPSTQKCSLHCTSYFLHTKYIIASNLPKCCSCVDDVLC